jgi:hypothetical protein
MKKSEFQKIIEAIRKVREILTPEQIAQVPYLFPDLANIDRDIEPGEKFRDGNEVFEAKEKITREELKKPEHKEPAKHKHKPVPKEEQKWEKQKAPAPEHKKPGPKGV